MHHKIGITLGDPAGIGPEITLQLLKSFPIPDDIAIILYGSFPYGKTPENFTRIDSASDIDKMSKSTIFWLPIVPEVRCESGKPSVLSGKVAYETIKKAGENAYARGIDAIVTCPVSKHYIQLSYSDFIGHTEFFAKQAQVKTVVMSFFSDNLRIALLTTHVPLKDLPRHLNITSIVHKIKLFYQALQKYLLIESPRIALLGLNPHCGEECAFGDEEKEIFQPAIEKLSHSRIKVDGPFPADTFFAVKYKDYDGIIASYHDQGLIPFKLLSFGKGVNVTLGLPYIRTSVDHGTAFDIAGKGIASYQSLKCALDFAIRMVK